MRRQSQAGFTIVEIMIIVTIIGILAALTLPSIRSNAIRVKMSEALLAFGTCRNVVTEFYQSGGDDPPADGIWGCEIDKDASKYVDQVKVIDTGTIVISLHGFGDPRLDTMDLTLAPLDNTGQKPSGNGAPIRSWRCGSAADGTQVQAQYLPSTCRG